MSAFVDAFPHALRFHAADWLRSGPVRLGWYARWSPSVRSKLVDERTALVIEGYPRSANSYALSAFRLANGDDIPVAHHLHTAVNVGLGVRRGLPVVLLLREPLDAATSLLLRAPDMSPVLALRRYVRLHEAVAPLADRLVVAPFGAVVADFGAVLAEVNERFGTSFALYEPTPENEERVRLQLDWWEFVESGFVTMNELAVPRPSDEREQLKPRLAERLRAHAAELERARALYERLMSHAPPLDPRPR